MITHNEWISTMTVDSLTLIVGFGGRAGLGDLSVPLTSGVASGVLAACGGDRGPLKALLVESPDAVFLTIWGWEVTVLLATAT